MSKSLGNGIDPLQVVELYGADALRYTVIAGSGLGTDVLLNHENLEESFSPGRNFANKVWNAGRFALMNLGDVTVRPVTEVEADLELADRWILSRLSVAVTNVTRSLEAFRFQEAAETVYQFFWSELADWYLELIKPRFYESGTAESKAAARSTLVEVLDAVLRLMHPLMPFISDALWCKLPETTGAQREASLVIAKWPDSSAHRLNEDAEAQMNALMELIGQVRNLRSEYAVPAGAEIHIRIANVGPDLDRALQVEERAVRRLARVVLAGADVSGGATAGAHAVLRSGGDLFVPLADLIDVDRERGRLTKELDRLQSQLRVTEAKLTNEQFIGKAPEPVIEREREKAASLRDQHQRLLEKLAALE
jgi:valyl-tRNA synthetase